MVNHCPIVLRLCIPHRLLCLLVQNTSQRHTQKYKSAYLSSIKLANKIDHHNYNDPHIVFPNTVITSRNLANRKQSGYHHQGTYVIMNNSEKCITSNSWYCAFIPLLRMPNLSSWALFFHIFHFKYFLWNPSHLQMEYIYKLFRGYLFHSKLYSL